MKKPFQLLFLAVISALLIACGNTPKEEVCGLPFGESHDEIIDILKKKNGQIVKDNPYHIVAASSAGFDLYGLKWDTIDCAFNRGGELYYVGFDKRTTLERKACEQLMADITSKYGDGESKLTLDEFEDMMSAPETDPDDPDYVRLDPLFFCNWEMAPVQVDLFLAEDRAALYFNAIDFLPME